MINRTFVKVNPPLCRIMRYSEQELAGSSTCVLYPDDETYERMGKELYKQLQETDPGVLESHARRKDGKNRDVLLCLSPFDPTDATAGVTATILDITEGKQAEDAPRRAERKLRTLLENIPDGIVRFDADCRHLYANPSLSAEVLRRLAQRLHR